MKTILFDLYEAQPAGTSKFHGGGEYIKTAYKYIVDNLLDSCNLIVFYDDSRFIDEWIIKSFSDERIICETITDRSEVKKIFNKYNIDVFYSGLPYYYRKEWFPDGVVKRGTIHGLRNIEMPYDKYIYQFQDGNNIKYKIKNALSDYYFDKLQRLHIKRFNECVEFLDEIVCVSNHTRYSLLSIFPQVISKRVETFYTPEKYLNTDSLDMEIIVRYATQKYVLLMGGDRWIKNLYRSCMAIDQLITAGLFTDYTAIVVGGIPRKIMNNIHNKKFFIELPYVSSEQLEALYKCCDIFLYPSLNEGFGMPPLEAMKYGKTCIVSGVCSMPEVCGEAAYYVNPIDITEIRNRILMAKDIKISEDIVMNHLNNIQGKQRTDLVKLCEFIIS